MNKNKKRAIYLPIYAELYDDEVDIKDSHRLFDIHAWYHTDEDGLHFTIEYFYMYTGKDEKTGEDKTVCLEGMDDYAISLLKAKYDRDGDWQDSLWDKSPQGCGYDLTLN